MPLEHQVHHKGVCLGPTTGEVRALLPLPAYGTLGPRRKSCTWFGTCEPSVSSSHLRPAGLFFSGNLTDCAVPCCAGCAQCGPQAPLVYDFAPDKRTPQSLCWDTVEPKLLAVQTQVRWQPGWRAGDEASGVTLKGGRAAGYLGTHAHVGCALEANVGRAGVRRPCSRMDRWEIRIRKIFRVHTILMMKKRLIGRGGWEGGHELCK